MKKIDCSSKIILPLNSKPNDGSGCDDISDAFNRICYMKKSCEVKFDYFNSYGNCRNLSNVTIDYECMGLLNFLNYN